jgi:hypothetical protein
VTVDGDPPERVRALAEHRVTARSNREFAVADSLRDEIAAAGWIVRDTPEGYELSIKPPYDVLPDVGAIPSREVDATGDRRATVALLVDGWPDDVDACLGALLTHLPADVGVLALDVADVDGAGRRVHELAAAHPDVMDELHVVEPSRYGAARAALLRYDTSPIHIWMETSTVVDGDVVTPLLAALEDPTVVGAGWRGVNVDPDWHGFHDATPGRDVEALLGYLFAMRTDAATAVAEDPESPLSRARFYRNVDLELSFWLRDAGGRLVVPAVELPVHQQRHRGYHDTDPAYRDRESKRNYDRFLARFRGRDDLRLHS